MSTVPPDEPLDEPPPAVLLLPLLLQPAAARATAARAAAIAGVRFKTFMIFLSFNWPARRPGAHRPTRSGLHRGATADPAPCHRERVGRSFPHPADAGPCAAYLPRMDTDLRLLADLVQVDP